MDNYNSGRIIYEPEFADWSAILSDNLRLTDYATRNELRQQLLEAAIDYNNDLSDLASTTAGIKLARAEVVLTDFRKSIVMTGHQPLIYHPGLLRKNIALDQIRHRTNSLAVNLMIDLDETDAGLIKFPGSEAGRPASRSVSLAEGIGGLLKFQRLKDHISQSEIWNHITFELKSCSAPVNWELFELVKKNYLLLSGHLIAEANSIVRSLQEPPRSYLELPLSILIKLPIIQKLILTWATDGDYLNQVYNSSLKEHRIVNGIKSSANPFPDLKTVQQSSSHDLKEIPFWLIDERNSKRLSVWCQEGKLFSNKGSGQFEPYNSADSNCYLSPRGAMLSLLYRGFCSDLFIHGLGGRSYDSFTNRLAPKLINRDLPRFVVASETRYIFQQLAEETLAWEHLDSIKRDLISHTEDYLELSLFGDDERKQLRELLEQKKSLIALLSSAQTPLERVPFGQQLKTLNDHIRKIVEERLLASRPYQDQESRDTWLARDYPTFFFNWD